MWPRSLLVDKLIVQDSKPSSEEKQIPENICWWIYFKCLISNSNLNSNYFIGNSTNIYDRCDPSTCTYNQRLSRACIVHLVIKKNNWSYVKTMYCSGSHLGITINIKNTKFVKDLPMIDAQFRFNQCNSFREEYISVFSPYGSVLILWPVVAAILDFRSA